jgi:hypothetical protein
LKSALIGGAIQSEDVTSFLFSFLLRVVPPGGERERGKRKDERVREGVGAGIDLKRTQDWRGLTAGLTWRASGNELALPVF